MKIIYRPEFGKFTSLIVFKFMIASIVIFGNTVYAEPLVSTTKGLDLETVTLMLRVPYQHYDRLFIRAVNHFQKEGLQLNVNDDSQSDSPLLKLTLDLKPLSEDCEGKFLYSQKLELYENVVSERVPNVRTWSVTWTYGLPDPIFIESKKTIQDLERDLDGLIGHFIFDYKFANQLKK